MVNAGGSIWVSQQLLKVLPIKSPNSEVNIPNMIPITGFWAVTAASAEISAMWWVAGMANPVWAKIRDTAAIPKQRTG